MLTPVYPAIRPSDPRPVGSRSDRDEPRIQSDYCGPVPTSSDGEFPESLDHQGQAPLARAVTRQVACERDQEPVVRDERP